MDEAGWLAGTDAVAMLRAANPRATDRRLRLFAAACCRVFWADYNARATRDAVETCERFADGRATAGELGRARSAAHAAAWQAFHATRLGGLPAEVPRRMYFAAFMANSPDRLRADPMPLLTTDPALARAAPDLVRCLFGNPFRPAAFDPAWRTSAAAGLAACAYDLRAFHDLPVLADALEEAGCDDPVMLAHCRAGGPHARGCWVVDSVLGRG